MKRQGTELLVPSLIAIAIVAIVAGAWRVKSFPPPERAPAMSMKRDPTPNKVVNDMSRELLICYNQVDICSKRLDACIDAYLEKIRTESLP